MLWASCQQIKQTSGVFTEENFMCFGHNQGEQLLTVTSLASIVPVGICIWVLLLFCSLPSIKFMTFVASTSRDRQFSLCYKSRGRAVACSREWDWQYLLWPLLPSLFYRAFLKERRNSNGPSAGVSKERNGFAGTYILANGNPSISCSAVHSLSSKGLRHCAFSWCQDSFVLSLSSCTPRTSLKVTREGFLLSKPEGIQGWCWEPRPACGFSGCEIWSSTSGRKSSQVPAPGSHYKMKWLHFLLRVCLDF